MGENYNRFASLFPFLLSFALTWMTTCIRHSAD
jgi:hypothetical protein